MKTQMDLENLTDSHIYFLVSAQIEREFENESDVAYDINAAIIDAAEEKGDAVEIFEWWTVSSAFGYHAKLQGEIVFETPFGMVWGRQTTGQPVYQDLNVQQILENVR